VANSSIALNDRTGSAYAVDTETQTGGDHRQVMVQGDPSTSAEVLVDATFGARSQVSGYQPSSTTGTITTSTSTVPASAVGYGNATITVRGTYAGVSYVFEYSDDGGTSWLPMQVVQEDTGQILLGDTPGTNASVGYLVDLPGWTNVRVRATAFISGTATVRISPGGMPMMPVVSVGNTASGTAAVPTTTALSTTAAQVVAANTKRRGIKLWNNSAVKAFVGLGAGTVTTANASFTIQPDATWEDPNWNGRCSAILASGTGSMNATEPTP
jgi:hypothetical protein